MIKKYLLFTFSFMLLTLGSQKAFAQTKKEVTTSKTTGKKTVATSKTVVTKKTVTKPTAAPIKKTIPIKKNMENATRVKITTDMGIIIVRLYDETPLHKANFIKLVEEHFYDSLLFHRIIPAFMIQGGDPMSKNAMPGAMLGMGGGDMPRIPAEFDINLFHKKGALAGARDQNPGKASSACQFYIVQGRKYTAKEIDDMEKMSGKKFTAEAKDAYINLGGTPFLDQEYTVFGEVESGLEVVDKIAEAPQGAANRPTTDIHMTMEIIK